MENEERPEGESTEVQVLPTQLEAVEKGGLAAEIEAAKRNPRGDLSVIKREMISLATMDTETAAECGYSIPRAGKLIQGPSCRLAEIAAYAWRNCRLGARRTEVADRSITIQAVWQDTERNYHRSVEVTRQIVDGKGRRYTDDMIRVTTSAAMSIGLRDVTFQGIPRAIINDVYRQAMKVAVGDQKTLPDRRDALLGWFAKAGIPAERIIKSLGHARPEDISLDDLETMFGVAQGIKDNQIKVDEAFPIPEPGEQKPPGATIGEQTKEAIKRRPGRPPKAAEPPPESPKTETPPAENPPASRGPVTLKEIADLEALIKKSALTEDDVLGHFKKDTFAGLTIEQLEEATQMVKRNIPNE